jgi:hypothetical protein
VFFNCDFHLQKTFSRASCIPNSLLCSACLQLPTWYLLAYLQSGNHILAPLANVPSKWAGLFSLLHVPRTLPRVGQERAVPAVWFATLQRMMKLLLAARIVRALNSIGQPLLTQYQPLTAGVLQRVAVPVQTRLGLCTREWMGMTFVARWEWLAYSIIQAQLPVLVSPLQTLRLQRPQSL